MDLIDPTVLGEVVKYVTDNGTTVLTTGEIPDLFERVEDVRTKI